MKLGALWPPVPDVKTLLVETGPLRTGFVMTRDDLPYFQPAPKRGRLFIEDYLLVQSVVENDTHGRKKKEAIYSAHSEAIEAFGRAMIDGIDQNISSTINNLVQERLVKGKLKKEIFLTYPNDDAVGNAFFIINKFPGMSIFRDAAGVLNVRIKEDAAAVFLTGGWLEALIFNRLKAKFGNQKIEFAANMSLHDVVNNENFEKWGEADIAFMVNDQLHIIEAKASDFVGANKAKAKAVNQVAQFKIKVLGQFGKMWVVNPVAKTGAINSSFEQKVGQGGGSVMSGPGAVDEMVAEVGRLLIAE